MPGRWKYSPGAAAAERNAHARPGHLHAWRGPQPLEERRHEGEASRVAVVGAARQGEVEGQHALGVEARVGARRVRQAAQQQARGRQQHHRQRDLRAHEDRLRTVLPPGRGAPAPAVDRAADRRAPRPDGRHQSEEHARDQRDRHRGDEHPRVQGGPERQRQGVGRHVPQHLQDERRDAEAEAATKGGEGQALGDQLPDDAAAAGAECGACRQLRLALPAARQDEVRDVGARDQQQERHRAEQQEHRRARDHAERRGDRLGEHPPRLFEGGILRVEPFLDGAQFLVRALEGGLRRQPSEDGGPVTGACGAPRARRQHGRHEEAVVAEQPRLARQHPHDRPRHVVEHQRAAEDARVAAEARLPELLGEHHHVGRPARPILLGQEAAPEPRRHAQHLQELVRHLHAGEPLGAAVVAQVVGDRIGQHDVR